MNVSIQVPMEHVSILHPPNQASPASNFRAVQDQRCDVLLYLHRNHKHGTSIQSEECSNAEQETSALRHEAKKADGSWAQPKTKGVPPLPGIRHLPIS